MNFRMNFRTAALATALVASNIGIAADTVHGYQQAAINGGDPIAHTHSGAFVKGALEVSADFGGVVGVLATYGAVTVAGMANLPGIYAGEAIGKHHYHAPR